MDPNALKTDHALIIGGGIAGLLAARALSERFRRVTIVERDSLGENQWMRKGAPQGVHGHALLLSGSRVMEELFPGWSTGIVKAGATPVDFAEDFRFFHFGVWKARYRSELRGTLQSRPLVERYIRERLTNISNIELRGGSIVDSLIADKNLQRVTGVRVRPASDRGSAESVKADLVVDAGGQGSRTPQWLQGLGYEAPEIQKIPIDLGYATRLYRPPSQSKDWRGLVIYPKAPMGHRTGYIFCIENGLWQVTLAGYLGDHPPGDEEGFLAFARELSQPHLYESIQTAIPESSIYRLRFPAATWRRYDRLRRFPSGLVVLGDAICRPDPTYAHGMSLAAKEACVISRYLFNHSALDLQRRLYWLLLEPWLITESEAYRHPQMRCRRNAIHRTMQWFGGNIYELSSSDEEVHALSFEVMHLSRRISSLLRPSVIGRVIANSVRSLG
jgi:2-polyprenyl-6-methoxyphenol hydroxylase-like FAD-dependent oxidoreductase